MSEICSKMYTGLHAKYLLLSSDFNETWTFGTVSKNSQISNFMKIYPVGAAVFHADRWMDEQTW